MGIYGPITLPRDHTKTSFIMEFSVDDFGFWVVLKVKPIDICEKKKWENNVTDVFIFSE